MAPEIERTGQKCNIICSISYTSAAIGAYQGPYTMKILAEDKQIEKALNNLHQCLLDNGAWFHDDLRLISSGNGLLVEMDGPCNPGNIITKVPTKLLVPVKPLNMTLKGNDFAIDPDKDGLSPEQIELGHHMIEIYNLTGRPDFHRNENAWIRFRRAPELLGLLLEGRDTNINLDSRFDYMHAADKDVDHGAFLCDSFWHSRVLGHKNAGSDERIQKVMPFVDYMNHHFRGSPFSTPDKKNGPQMLRIRNNQPLLNKREVFAHYGMYDALDTFLIYGFVDSEAPFVRSIPLELSLDGTSTLTIKSLIGNKAKKPLNKALKNLMSYSPALNKDEEGNLIASHMLIPIGPSPHAMRRILRSLVHTLCSDGASPQYVIDLTFRLEYQIITKNIEFYRDVLTRLEKHKDAPADLVDTIRQICDNQLTKLYKYMYDRDFFTRGQQGQAQAREAQKNAESSDNADEDEEASAGNSSRQDQATITA